MNCLSFFFFFGVFFFGGGGGGGGEGVNLRKKKMACNCLTGNGITGALSS